MSLLCRINSQIFKKINNILKPFGRFHSSKSELVPVDCLPPTPCSADTIAVIVAVYKSGENVILSETAKQLDLKFKGKLSYCLDKCLPYPDFRDVRVFHGLDPVYTPVVVVGAGRQCVSYNMVEQIDERKEIIRTIAGAGMRALFDFDIRTVYVDSFGHSESAAEGASMAAWLFQDSKCPKKRKRLPRILLYNSCDFTGWQIGMQKAAAQNLARYLEEKPGNDLTPQLFAQTAVELLSRHNINVEVRMEQWAERRNLHAFLAVSKGSCEPPIFLEILYEGCDPTICPIVLIGKGVTFNSGGLCLHKCRNMRHGRGDMAGAAMVVAAMRAVAILQLPINIRGLIPLCANSPGSLAYKPGDIIKAYNGRTILVGTTNCDGLLLHADALSYSKEYKPKVVLDVGTGAYDMAGAIGEAACGCFSSNESLYEMMRVASIHTGDRIWRFPLWDYFSHYIKHTKVSDFTNHLPKMIGGGSCKAASFLKEFVPPKVDWIHLDMTNVMRSNGKDFTYLRKGMSGRPTRTIIEFLAQFACNHEH